MLTKEEFQHSSVRYSGKHVYRNPGPLPRKSVPNSTRGYGLVQEPGVPLLRTTGCILVSGAPVNLYTGIPDHSPGSPQNTQLGDQKC